MKFEQKFDIRDFIYVLSSDIPVSTAEIMRRVGCCRNTAKQYLSELEKSQQIKKITITGSRSYGWVRV